MNFSRLMMKCLYCIRKNVQEIYLEDKEDTLLFKASQTGY